MAPPSSPDQYAAIVRKVFRDGYRRGAKRVAFKRQDLVDAASALRLSRPGNLGDVIYAYRFRRPLPDEVQACAPPGREWVIRLSGRGEYAFEAVKQAWFLPNRALSVTKLPDATPEIITKYALNDEQALLAILRYNRLIDIFAGVTCYSLQSHLRTTVEGVGQIETDEVYLGVDQRGAHYVLPVQAKGGSDILSVVQIEQDFGLAQKPAFRDLIARPIGAQFVEDDDDESVLIALFEFEADRSGISVARERHYRLVKRDELTTRDLRLYGRRAFD